MANQNMIYASILILPFTTLADQSESDRSSYIVHIDSSGMPKAFAHPHDWYLATLTSISDNLNAYTTTTNDVARSSAQFIYAYSHVINGFSASLSAFELEALTASFGYLSSVKDSIVTIYTTRSAKFLRLNHGFGAWSASEYSKDVIVGVVDSGVWPESESFSDDGMTEVPTRWKGECQSDIQLNSSMCNKKLIGVRYYSKGWQALFPTEDFPMNSSRDTTGHGTHASTIVAGNYVDDLSYSGYARVLHMCCMCTARDMTCRP